MNAFVAFLFLSLSSGVVLSSDTPRCRNPDGDGVEWFIIYKMPKTDKHDGSSFDPKGYELAYVDSTFGADTEGWKLLSADATESEGNPIAQTLSDFYRGSKPEDSLYVVYNDQVPDPYKGTAAGHTKGVVQARGAGGFWLAHTVPQFPAQLFSDSYDFPASGQHYGQTFLCISFDIDQLPKIAVALRQQSPKIYESGAPDELLLDEDVEALVNKKSVRKPKEAIVEDEIEGIDGTKFLSVAKHKSFNDEIYAQVISPKLGANILVETWRNGAGGKLAPECPIKGYTTTNMANVVIRFDDGQKVIFDTTQDHSKWAISDDASKPWFCAGSLNRMKSQYLRGGQTTCIENELVHRLFSTSVEKCQICGSKQKRSSYCSIPVPVDS